MGKIWLSGPDTNKKCCGCVGKTGPCSPCCNCSTIGTIGANYQIVGSGVLTFPGASVSKNPSSITIAGSASYDSSQEAATRTILSISVAKGETITLTSAYTAFQHYFAKPQYSSSFGFNKTASYASALKCGSNIAVGIPCEATKKNPNPQLSDVFNIGVTNSSTLLGTQFSEVMVEADFACEEITEQSKMEILSTVYTQTIKRKNKRQESFGEPYWNFTYDGYDPSTWEITNTTETFGYDPFDNVPENDGTNYPGVQTCFTYPQLPPDPAGYPNNAIVEFTTISVTTSYRLYRREYSAGRTMNNSVNLTARKACCIMVQFDGYPIANNEQFFFTTQVESDTQITASMFVGTDAAKLNIVEIKCQDFLGNTVPCP